MTQQHKQLLAHMKEQADKGDAIVKVILARPSEQLESPMHLIDLHLRWVELHNQAWDQLFPLLDQGYSWDAAHKTCEDKAQELANDLERELSSGR